MLTPTPTDRLSVTGVGVKYLAKDDESLKNGTFYRIQTYKRTAPTISRWILGDCHGYGHVPPFGLREYTSKEANKILAGR